MPSYPITCAGGYPVPIKAGKMEVTGVLATADSTAAASRLTLVDDDAYSALTDDSDAKPVLADLKGIANSDGNISVFFSEPIKVRKGVTVCNASNLLGGRVFVYIR